MTTKRGIVLYLHMHQPYRVREYSVFETAQNHDYFDEPAWDLPTNNQRVFEQIANKSYRPMTLLLEKLLTTHQQFKVSLSMSGTFLEQAEAWAPDVVQTLRRLVETGKVELLAETYYHSLAFFYSRPEFERQVALHRKKLQSVFGVTPSVFRGTELAYNDEIATWADENGYKGILAEGWDPVLEWRSPNHVYRPAGTSQLALLLKNYRLSDDLAFRFSNKAWSEYPLTADKFSEWTTASISDHPLINLFMDFETFGEHQWADSGIFDFFEHFVGTWLDDEANTFYTVSDAIGTFEPVGELSMPHTVTWADAERDLSAWTGNAIQGEALRHLFALEETILRTEDEALIDDWRCLQSSDHTYYMSTKWHADGEVHQYFSPYDSPYSAFLTYMNVIRDIRWRIMQHRTSRAAEEHLRG